MPKFYVAYRIDHVGEAEIEADTIEEARQIASLDSTKAWADWQMLEDVSDAEITEVERIWQEDDFHL